MPPACAPKSVPFSDRFLPPSGPGVRRSGTNWGLLGLPFLASLRHVLSYAGVTPSGRNLGSWESTFSLGVLLVEGFRSAVRRSAVPPARYASSSEWLTIARACERRIFEICKPASLAKATISRPTAHESVHDWMIATARVQPAEARSIFVGKQQTMKPIDGSDSRLCNFSIWQ